MRGRRAGGMVAVLVATGALGTAPAAGMAQQTVELPAEDRPIRLAPEPVYAVGGAMEEAAWQIFGELGGPANLAFDGAGNLHVFDRDNSRVVVVGPDGRLVREFGRQGEGPGEWRMPVAMTVLRDGRVVITDLGHRAHLIHGPDGAVERTVSLETGGGAMAVGATMADPRGGHLYSATGAGGMRIRVSAGGGPEDDEPGRIVERVDLSDGSTAPFFTAWQPPRQAGGRGEVLRGGAATFRIGAGGPRTFEPGLHVDVLPDGGLAVADTSTWRVTMVGPEGGVERVVRRPHLRPREVTPEVEETERARRLEELEAGEGPRMRIMVQGPGGGRASPLSDDQIEEMQRNRIASMRFYPEIPVIARLEVGWEGTTWVERTGERWWEEGPVDVVRPDGRYVGTLAADGPGIPAAFGPDGLAAYLERDDFDVPTIRVVRLPEPLR